MNIIVLTHSGRVVTRPDTSWEKESRDIYLPDFVKTLSLSPVLFIKITKPGRSISEKFASRYYESFGFGCLLYAENLLDAHPEAYASASCLDHSSILPSQMSPIEVLAQEEQDFRVELNGTQIASCHSPSVGDINKAIATATSHCSVRHGDLIAIELGSRVEFPTQDDDNHHIETYHKENKTILLNIVF